MKILNINKLLIERETVYTERTQEILTSISDKLSDAFRKVYNAGSTREFKWNDIQYLDGSTKSVMVEGSMLLELGETITINDENILIDENNIKSYNRYIKFAFPIILLEFGSADELATHMETLSKISSFANISPQNLVKLMDKASDEYNDAVLNDPSKLALIDAATKPSDILGFSAELLNDAQIRALKMIEKMDLGGLQ